MPLFVASIAVLLVLCRIAFSICAVNLASIAVADVDPAIPCATDVCTTTGLATGTQIGTLSVTVNPITSTFSYTTPNLSLTTSGATCNATNGAGNSSFQIANDALKTNGTPGAGTYKICVNATESGATAIQQAFTVTVGTLRDAAAGVGTGGCTGSGTSGSPWNYLCIQNAINAAVDGDTVFLRGGNWALNTTADASHVTIYNKAITVLGVASGNTFDTWGHINNPKPVSPNPTCPTSGTAVTCVYQVGQSYAFQTCADGGVTGNTHTSITLDNLSANVLQRGWLVGDAISGSGIPANDTIATIAANGLSITLASATTTTVSGAALSVVRFPWNCSGYIHIGPTSNSSPDPNCHDVKLAHIFFDGSQSTAGGDLNALVSIIGCAGPVTYNDLRFIANTGQSVGGGTTSGETQIATGVSNNITILNSLFTDPFIGGGVYAGPQVLQLNGGNGFGSNFLVKNNIVYQGAFNPIFLSSVTYAGNQNYNFNDGTGVSVIDPAAGYAGDGLGGFTGTSATGVTSGDTNNSLTNNLWYAPGNTIAIGSTINDPSTSGGELTLNVTGNYMIAATPDIDSCTWHLFNDQGNCAPGSDVGMSINMAVDSSCNVSNNSTPFNVTNNSLKGTSAAYLNARGGGGTATFTGTISGTTLTVSGVTGTITSGTDSNGIALEVVEGSGVAIGTGIVSGTGPTYTVSVSQSVGPVAMSASTATECKVGVPWGGTSRIPVPIRVYGYKAQNNWLSSPSNQYATDSSTISPVQTGNFCTTAAGTVTGCATSGFNTLPTASFTLGPLNSAGVVPINNPTFTAQYGAVQWLASTSSTPPTLSDSRWSSNNGSFPNSAANSYVPPVSLSGVTHGNTVYLWVMDSANNISAATSQVVP